MENFEIDDLPELTAVEKVCAGAAVIVTILGIVAVFLIASLTSGCRYFYENAGVSARMGSVTAPIEISEPTSSFKGRLLFAMDGIDFYAAKGCIAEMEYENVHTNSYLGIVETRGRQHGKVKITPCESVATNAVCGVE